MRRGDSEPLDSHGVPRREFVRQLDLRRRPLAPNGHLLRNNSLEKGLKMLELCDQG